MGHPVHDTHKNDGIEMREETHSEILKTVRKWQCSRSEHNEQNMCEASEERFCRLVKRHDL